MICYVVTENLHFTHPDYKYLNPKMKNIVPHICDDEKEAWEYIDIVVKFPLYKPFNGKFRKKIVFQQKSVGLEAAFLKCISIYFKEV